jgi:DNA processing protein
MPGPDAAERRARMVLSAVVEPGDADACRLVREHSASELLAKLRSRGATAGSTSGLSPSSSSSSSKVATWVQRAAAADDDAVPRAAAAVSARYVCPGDDEWEPALDDLARLEDEPGDRRGGAPFGLWLRGGGSLSALSRRCVAIVGARRSTPYGEHVASGLAFDAASHGFAVVSGGAYGIDAAAHRAVLSCGGPTLAVLAGGVDNLYPTGNGALLGEVAVRGLLVSEAPPGCVPSRSRFLVRNRLIAALSRGTVVVEAALRSGALNTARWALDLGRGVMGVPGPVTSRTSAGVHELLRQPGTLLVTDALEMIEHVSPAGVGLAPRKSGRLRPVDSIEGVSRRVLDAMPKLAGAPAESIALDAGVRPGEVGRHLARLRDAGLVTESADGWALAAPRFDAGPRPCLGRQPGDG